MRNTIILLLSITNFFVQAQQTDLNNYKYIVVDNQYDFQNEANEYRFNELVVFELEKRNFKAFRNSQVLPADLNRGTCNSLRLKINKTGTTRVNMTLALEDCVGNTIFSTKEGVGRTKSFDKAYFEALRDAMTSFDEVEYVYTDSLQEEVEIELKKAKDLNIVYSKDKEVAPGFNKEINDSKQPSVSQPEDVEVVNDQIYRTKSKEYFILSTETGFDIYKNKGLIGTLKKSKGGCFFVETTDFMGVAYETSKGISIEYTYFGKDQILEFSK
jgi:hypothetical protein